ncbi:TetR/AcrR family transcriptional regulator [Kitasatospora sp. NPDC059327]|uniref:TetR/AcrR family transcriptional regulator n=1 Tax=Kitasatospora sp. NPDC059327 TaxID=3346803 RepID=UPI00367FB283
MVISSPTPESHRERVKAQRRDDIVRAGMRLFTEHGYDGATIADIGRAANVAPRTVQQYFPAKQDIALSLANDIASRLTATLQEHPDVSFLDAVDRWLVREAELNDPELMALNQAMFEANPELQALCINQLTDAVRLCSAGVSAETGLPVGHPLYTVVVSAAAAALSEYIRTAHHYRDAPDLHAHFIACLRALLHAAREPRPLPPREPVPAAEA